LTQAIELFISEKFLSNITLAGAAEEIFGRPLAIHGYNPMAEQSFSDIQRIQTITGLTIMRNRPKKEIFNEWNSVKKNLKHHSEVDGDTVIINVFDEAYWIIK